MSGTGGAKVLLVVYAGIGLARTGHAQQTDAEQAVKEAIRTQLLSDTAWARLKEVPDQETFNRDFKRCTAPPIKPVKCFIIDGNHPIFMIIDIHVSPPIDYAVAWVMVISPERDSLGFAFMGYEWSAKLDAGKWLAVRTGAVRSGSTGTGHKYDDCPTRTYPCRPTR